MANEKTNTITGEVFNCKMLNIRTQPNKKSKVLTVVKAGDMLEIDLVKSTKAWYAVTTKFGDSGFCMRKFVNA